MTEPLNNPDFQAVPWERIGLIGCTAVTLVGDLALTPVRHPAVTLVRDLAVIL